MPGLDIPVRSAPMQETSAMTTVDHYARPLAIVTTLFFMWGFLTSLNDILVPHLKSIFGYPPDAAENVVLPFEQSRFVDPQARQTFIELLDRDGQVIQRYGSTTAPEDIAGDIEAALSV